MNNHRDIQGIRRIVRQESPPPLTPGRVVAKLLRGVRVQLTGSNLTVEAEVIRGADVNVGDDVVAIRLEGQHKWIVLGASDRSSPSSVSSGSAPDGPSSPLAPPDGVRAYNGWGFIVVAWSAPIQRPDISFQVQVEDDVDGSENVEYFTTAGSSYLYVAPPGTRKRFRVCTVDKNYRKSGWSAFVTGQSEGIFFATGMSTNLPDPEGYDEGEPFYAYDTKTLYILHNNVWEAVAGGDGGASPTDPGTGPGYWDPAAPPEQANPLNNEFSSTPSEFELDSRSTGALGINIINNALVITRPYESRVVLIRRPIPSGQWTAVTRLRITSPTDTSVGMSETAVAFLAGITEDPANTGIETCTGLAIDRKSWLPRHYSFRMPDGVMFKGLPLALGRLTAREDHLTGYYESHPNTSPLVSDGQWLYIRLRHTGKSASSPWHDIWVDVSMDGFVWESASSGLWGEPTWIGFAVKHTAPLAYDPAIVEIDFFRFDSKVHAPDDPVFGRWIGTNLSTRANVVGDVVAFTHNTVSPLELGDVEAGDHIHACKVFIDEPFDGTVSLSVGEPGAPGRLIDASMIDPKEAGLYESWPEYTYQGAASLHLYLAKSGTTQGAGRVILLRKERYNG